MKSRRYYIDWGEVVVPAIALSFGIAFFVQTADGPLDALMWPIITAAMLLVFWVPAVKKFVLKKEIKKPDAGDTITKGPFWPGLLKGRVSLILYACAGYLLLIPRLGFSLTNFAFMLIVFRSLGSRHWGRNLAVAVGISLFLHLALVVFMKQDLPRLGIGGLPF